MASDFEILFDAGSASIQAGDFAEAKAYFEEAAAIDPAHAPTKALLEKLEQLVPSSDPIDDDDDDILGADGPLFSLDGATATQPAAAKAATARPVAAETERVKEDMLWSDLPKNAPSSSLAPGATVAVVGGDTPIGRKMLSALAAGTSSTPLVGVPLGPSYTAEAAKVFASAEAIVLVSASAGGKGGVEPPAMKALLDAVPTSLNGGGLKRMVLLSSVGVDRTDKLPFNMANVFGQLDKVRAMEQEVLLRATGMAASFSIVRVGKLNDDANVPCQLASGDAFQGETGAVAVSSLLVQSLSRPEVVNKTFSAGGPPKASDAFAGWDDEFTKLVGPEVFRQAFRSTISQESALGWLRQWTRGLLAPGSGLTTPIEVVDVPDGVLLRFLKKDGSGYADFDKPETTDDKWAQAKGQSESPPTGDGGLLLLAEAQAGKAESARVRVRRAEMGDGAVPKPMSEAAVLEKLGRDLGLLDKARGR